MPFRSLLALLGTLLSTLALASEGSPPESPQIVIYRRVIFRLLAPKAKSVMLKGIHRTYEEMTRERSGVWSVTIDHLDPGIYEYSFMVDGQEMTDPFNPEVKPGTNPGRSVLEISTNTPMFYQWQKVPHGTVHLHSYYSESLKRRRRLRVYTPPGYERDENHRYPVLYLFHGSGDTEATWTDFGRAHLILDNLIAAGKTTPMLLIMPDGHADLQEEDGDHKANFLKFEAALLGSVLPLVDTTYRTLATPEGRAINGLSLGGKVANACCFSA